MSKKHPEHERNHGRNTFAEEADSSDDTLKEDFSSWESDDDTDNRDSGSTFEQNRARARASLEKRRKNREWKIRARKKRRRQIILKSLLAILLAVAAIAGILTIRRQAKNADQQVSRLAQAAVSSNNVETGSISASEAITSGSAAPEESQAAVTVTPEPVNQVSLVACGDNLIHQRLYEQAAARSADGTYDFGYLYQGVSPFIKEHDAAWIDVETLINDVYEPSGYPVFSTPGADGQSLIDAGFNVFSLSNNHVYDYLGDGIQATLDFWNTKKDQGIITTGLWTPGDYSNIPILEKNGYKIAFLTYTEVTNNDEPADTPERVIYMSETDTIQQQIAQARQSADAVVVSCHWGVEDSHDVTDEQRAAAQNIADWGADVIIGDHPHVIQDGQWIQASDGRQVFCVYSLGNLVSTQEQPDELIGVMLDCTLSFTDNGNGTKTCTIQNPRLIPTVTDYGEGGTNSHTVLFSDYTEEQADAHGIRETNPGFSLEYIKGVLETNISGDFLYLDNPLKAAGAEGN